MRSVAKTAFHPTSRPNSRLGPSEQSDSFIGDGRMALSAFSTPLGWMGLLGENDQLVSILIGRPSSKAVQAAAAKVCGSIDFGDWNPLTRERLEAYAAGEVVDFSAIEIRLPDMTSFRQQVVAATRRLRYGETVTYGELARRAGRPRAARAVGTVMSMNRFPLVVPCHRVLAAGNKLGGYTSPAGTALKQRMLDLEAQVNGAPGFRN